MPMMGLSLVGVVLLLVGIGLAIYGFNIEPTTGEAIGNLVDGEFTDKRNVLKFGGLALAVTGGVILVVGTMSGTRSTNA